MSEEKPFFKLLLVGPPGCGKSIGAASWIEEGISAGLAPLDSIMVFDFDFRYESLRNFYPNAFKQGVNFRSYGSGQYANFLDDFKSVAQSPPPTIILDSLTFLADGLMHYLYGFRSSRKKNDAEDSKGNVRRVGVIDIPHFPEWMGEASGISKVLDVGKNLDCNFIMTAHVTQSLDIAGGGGGVERIAKKNVIMQGSKSAQKVPGFFDEIWTCRAQQQISIDMPIQYLADTVPFGEELGKTCRSLPHEINFTHPTTLYREVKRLLNEPREMKQIVFDEPNPESESKPESEL